MQLPLFPLPLILLPQGITRLRIFEQRYLRMIKIAAANQGFVLSTYDPSLPHNTSDYGSWVKIIDFQTLEDGMLGIDIQAGEIVKIEQITVEPDKLCIAEVSCQPHWPEQAMNSEYQTLAQGLAQVFDANPQLTTLYTDPHFDDPCWICARWIELLPLDGIVKVPFYRKNSFFQAVEMLNSVVSFQQSQ